MNIQRTAFLSMLTTIALIIFVVEAQLPPIFPFPGAKLGLANIVTLFTMFTIGRKEAFIVLMVRILLGSFFAGQAISLLYSLSGGLFCFLILALFYPIFKGNYIWAAGIVGALAHNIGQIAVAILITQTFALISYLPFLLIIGIGTGLFTGLTSQFLITKLSTLINFKRFKSSSS